MFQLQIRQQIQRRWEVGWGPLGVGTVEGEVDRFLEEDGAEKLEAFVEGGRAGLLRIQLQVEVGEQVVGEPQGGGGVLGVLAEDEEVVRVAHEGLAEEGEVLVQLVED